MIDSASNAVIVGGAHPLVDLLTQTSRDLGFVTTELPLTPAAAEAVRQSSALLTVVVGDEPGDDVLETVRDIRAVSGTHLVILSILADPVDVMKGFEAGADDYMALPVGPRELNARLEAIMRRALRTPPSGQRPPTDLPAHAGRDPSAGLVSSGDTGGEERWLRHGRVAVNPDSGVVLVDQREVALTAQEFALLTTLLQSKRRVRNRSDLALVLRGEPRGQWYEVSDAEKAAVDECIRELTRKLGDTPGGSRHIESSTDAGYRLSRNDGWLTGWEVSGDR